MCGVVGIAYAQDNERLGREASALVRHLEYRGYDSTGVATIGADGAISLRKSVGAPSRVVALLDIASMRGQKAIGQVRWATYGSVTDENAQPHEVRCHVHVVGAHNGNISNTDSLKVFLREHGHHVVSDNDGEMLVHVIEHQFAKRRGTEAGISAEERRERAIEAIRDANRTVIGSYAACVSFPGIEGVFAIKAGSSLYAGKGTDAGGPFIVVSSDLTSVLSKTRALIPLAEGDCLHFTHDAYEIVHLHSGQRTVPGLRRSRLNVADIALQPPYRYFMEQEIAQAGPNLDALIRTAFADPAEDAAFAAFEKHHDDAQALALEVLHLAQEDDLGAAARRLSADPRVVTLRAEAGALPAGLVSEEAAVLAETGLDLPAQALLDRLVFWKKKREVRAALHRTLGYLREARSVYLVGSGTSYHACLTGAAFLAERTHIPAQPANPGMFRSTCLPALRKGDVVIGVTQSGETKDLVDVFNDVRAAYGKDVALLSLVNNENSTIPQEKSDAFLPILCGPEIAVPATKSFISQVAVFHLLAETLAAGEDAARTRLRAVQELIGRTIAATAEGVEDLARKLFLAPSLHVLGASLLGVAREGALKVREVVLNHTEGYDAAEFKHGPNTILGKNTVFSLADLERVLADLSVAAADGIDLRGVRSFADVATRSLQDRLGLDRHFTNYPLLFLCPPDARDVRITISQIHTHKIRGADVLLIAEEDAELRRAVEGRPDRVAAYDPRYVAVPATGDRHAFVYQASVVLQVLALRMSVLKMEYLDRTGAIDHGVHPDVPKNVSKSITVD